MNALDLLKDLTSAIVAVRDAHHAAEDAFKVAYSAPVTEKVAAKFARMEADTKAAHARHEYSAALSDALAYVAEKELA